MQARRLTYRHIKRQGFQYFAEQLPSCHKKFNKFFLISFASFLFSLFLFKETLGRVANPVCDEDVSATVQQVV